VLFRQRNTCVPHVNISREFCCNFVHKTRTERSPGKTKDTAWQNRQRCYMTCRQIFFPDVIRYNTNEECITAHLLLLLLSISVASRQAGKQRPIQIHCVRHCAVSHQHQTRANGYSFPRVTYSQPYFHSPPLSCRRKRQWMYSSKHEIKRGTRRPHVEPQFILRGPINELILCYKMWSGSRRILLLVKRIKDVYCHGPFSISIDILQ